MSDVVVPAPHRKHKVNSGALHAIVKATGELATSVLALFPEATIPEMIKVEEAGESLVAAIRRLRAEKAPVVKPPKASA